MYFGPVDEEQPPLEAEQLKKKDKKAKEKKLEVGSIVKELGLSKLILVLVCGIAIIVLSFPGIFSGDTSTDVPPTIEDNGITTSTKNENNGTTQEYTEKMENRLKQILMQVKDIGSVEVMITIKSSKELVPLKDQPLEEQTTTEQDSAGGSRESSSVNQQDETVLIDSGTGGSEPVIVKELEPELEGVLVICQGGESEFVKSEVVSAVLALFDVPAHKVKVMKMSE